MQKTSYRQALLMKRMAWRQMQPAKPSREEEARYVPTAIRMLTGIACLNYAMCDLESELSDAGMLRHAVKYRFGRCQERVQRVHQEAYIMLGRISPVAARQYNDKMEEAWRQIEDKVLLPPPERAYNIVVALCRVIGKWNDMLTGRYDFVPSRTLVPIPGMLSAAEIAEYAFVDAVIADSIPA